LLPTVAFSACRGDSESTLLEAGDPRFTVASDGTVRAAQRLHLKTGVTAFEVTALDPGTGQTLRTVVQLQAKKHMHDEHRHHRLVRHSGLNMRSGTAAGVGSDPGSRNQRRHKRAWVIPPIRITENDRGTLPQKLVQIKSDKVKTGVHYSITGPGADQAPIGVFSIESGTGWLFVNKILDREESDMYMLKGYAVDTNGNNLEDPVDLQIIVIDQNDNRPQFAETEYFGTVPEGSLPATSVMDVTATDKDDPNQDGGILKYKILSQEPPVPLMFTINTATGNIRTLASGLDREVTKTYKLIVEASDGYGTTGLTATATAIITVTDANDNPPIFDPITGTGCSKKARTDESITDITTAAESLQRTEAMASVALAMPLDPSPPLLLSPLLAQTRAWDYETTKLVKLLVRAENEVELQTNDKLSTATVTVVVEDVNEPPEFTPLIKKVSVSEDVAVGHSVAVLTAKDPDKEMNQKISYFINSDPMSWLTVDVDTGSVTTVARLDREMVTNSVYAATFLAKDNGSPPATGTGTLLLTLKDVNDNPPVLDVPQPIVVCARRNLESINLTVFDADAAPNTGPYIFELLTQPGQPRMWSLKQFGDYAMVNSMKENLPVDTYNISVRITDNGIPPMGHVSEVVIKVCECSDHDVCKAERQAAGLGMGAIIGILTAFLLLLYRRLPLLRYLARRCNKVVLEVIMDNPDPTPSPPCHVPPPLTFLSPQKYDASQLPYLLGEEMPVARPVMVTRYDQEPEGERPRFPARPPRDGSAEPNMSGFIDDSLKAADGDPTAPPFDTLLVFDFEGEGSVAGSVSTINTASSDEDQDYKFLDNWGPRFHKLADMYGGTE
uniref:Cadherin-1 n=1 Tax=Petromyzon marinus TaxID=7757 RepID=S4REE4_PETMA